MISMYYNIKNQYECRIERYENRRINKMCSK